MPFSLRPVAERDIPGHGIQRCYKLAGKCHAHGFMDEEGMVDSEQKKWTTILV